jgi:hypothetical protein
MTFIFLFDAAGLVVYGLIFGAQQILGGFWFFGPLFCGVGVVCCLCGCCFFSLQICIIVGKVQ